MIANAVWSNYFQVAKTALNAGDAATAETMFREALTVASALSLEPEYEANSAFGLALALLAQQSQRGEAQLFLRKAIRLYRTVNDLDCHVFVSCVVSLADSYCCESFPERALPLLKQAVKTVSAKAGLAAPHLVPLFKRMALIYSEKSYFRKAEVCFKRTLQSNL